MLLRSLILGLALALAAGGAASADPGRRGSDFGQNFSPNEAREAREQGVHVPLRNIFAMIGSRYPGRPLGTELVRGQPAVYVIEWLTVDGRKLTIRVNAETGAILGVEGG